MKVLQGLHRAMLLIWGYYFMAMVSLLARYYLHPLILEISELLFFIGLGFYIALVDSTFGVCNVTCLGF